MVAPTLSGDRYLVAVEGLDAVDFAKVPDRIKLLASRAVNATARKFRTEGAREIRQQINFPARYLTGRGQDNLSIIKHATPGALESVIRGRERATSLARFTKGQRVHGRKSPTVEVAPGKRVKMGRAFLMNLNSGNIGLAVRLKEGERVENKKFMVGMNNGLYLLYGPSVDQVFRDVAEDISDSAGEFLEREFSRLTETLL